MEQTVLDSTLEPIAQDEMMSQSGVFENDLANATSGDMPSAFSIEYFVGLVVFVGFLYLIYKLIRGMDKKIHHEDVE